MTENDKKDELDKIEFPKGFESMRTLLKWGRKEIAYLEKQITNARSKQAPKLELRPPLPKLRANLGPTVATLTNQQMRVREDIAGKLAPALDKASETERQKISQTVEGQLGISQQAQRKALLMFRIERDGKTLDDKQEDFLELRFPSEPSDPPSKDGPPEDRKSVAPEPEQAPAERSIHPLLDKFIKNFTPDPSDGLDDGPAAGFRDDKDYEDR